MALAFIAEFQAMLPATVSQKNTKNKRMNSDFMSNYPSERDQLHQARLHEKLCIKQGTYLTLKFYKRKSSSWVRPTMVDVRQ